MRRNILIGLAVLAAVAVGASLVIEPIMNYQFNFSRTSLSADPNGNAANRQARASLKAYRAAAKRGEATGQYGLGGMYYAGIAIEKNPQEAFKWFRKAAEQGMRPAQRNIAVMYYSGVGVAMDTKESFKWFLKAAKQKDAVAQFEVGKLYSKGEGVARDDKAAYVWYTVAAENGEPKAAGARDEMASNLTADQISEAKKHAQEWLDKHR